MYGSGRTSFWLVLLLLFFVLTKDTNEIRIISSGTLFFLERKEPGLTLQHVFIDSR